MFRYPINRWWIVFAGVVGSTVGAGTIMVYTYGILGGAMGAEFGWSRDLVARNMTAFLIGSGTGTLVLGWLISRFGIRLPSALLAGMFGVLFALIAWAPPNPSLHVMTFLVIGFCGSAGTALPYAVAISGFFDEHRGLALGLVVAGSGVGSTFGPAIAQYLVVEHGWRAGFSVIGIAAALIPAAGITFLVRTPEGVVARKDAVAGDAAPILRLTLLNSDFWRILWPILAVSMATFGAMTSLVPMFRDISLPPATIAGALSFAGLCSWGGRVVVGYALDKIFAPYICAIIFAGAACGLLLLITGTSALPLFAGAALVAIALGSEADLVTFLVSRYFRLIDYSRVVGVLWVVWAWGGGLGTYLAGRSFGIFDSYHPAFIGFALLLVTGAGIVVTLGPYRAREHRPARIEPHATIAAGTD